MENHFTFDPFALLALEKKFDIDLELLQQNYFTLQKKAHPDYLDTGYQSLSAQINKAYGILKDPIQRALALFALHQISPTDCSNELLEESLKWQEKIAEVLSVSQLDALQKELTIELENLFQEIRNFQGAEKDDQKKWQDILNKLMFFARIQDNSRNMLIQLSVKVMP